MFEVFDPTHLESRIIRMKMDSGRAPLLKFRGNVLLTGKS